MDNWNEVKTAACVARCGTISAAADELIGEFIVTSIDVLANSILPMLADFRSNHPQVTTHFHASNALVKLEYGEAHIAFRAGPKPQDPDNVVMPFVEIPVGLYASKKYIDRYGKPDDVNDFPNHQFVGTKADNPRAPALKWIVDNVPRKAMAFTSNHIPINNRAVLLGNGIGFLTTLEASQNPDLIEIMPPRAEWLTRSWALTHVDLHRSPKVQAFLKIMKQHLGA